MKWSFWRQAHVSNNKNSARSKMVMFSLQQRFRSLILLQRKLNLSYIPCRKATINQYPRNLRHRRCDQSSVHGHTLEVVVCFLSSKNLKSYHAVKKLKRDKIKKGLPFQSCVQMSIITKR